MKILRKLTLSDIEVVRGFQNEDANIESDFYKSCYRYFHETYPGVLSFKSDIVELEDLFQDSFLILWDEIRTRKIHVRDNLLCRFDTSGESRRMTASLKTYLMSIAKYKNFEVLREADIYVDEKALTQDIAFEEEAPGRSIEDIVSLMVNAMPLRCKEILTLFYYEEKTLDEILSIRKENVSKDGLKSSKSKCLTKLKEQIATELSKYQLNNYTYG
jgi:DNA-directed RNA polymerase specialized sigma24 family protein